MFWKNRKKYGGFLGALVGGLAGAVTSGLFNKSEASANREFQQYNSDTAHQREVKDLLAAGLNPILSVNSGASTPAGNAATMPAFENPVTAYRQNELAKKNTEEAQSRIDLNKENAKISSANAKIAEIKARKELENYAQTYGRSPGVSGAFSDWPNSIRGIAKSLGYVLDAGYNLTKGSNSAKSKLSNDDRLIKMLQDDKAWDAGARLAKKVPKDKPQSLREAVRRTLKIIKSGGY